MNVYSNSPKRIWRLILSVVFLFYCCGFTANAQITDPLDGCSYDWVDLDAAPVPTYFHAQDAYTGLDDQFTTGASDENFATKAWTYSQVKNKNNIANGAAVLIGTKLYFAGDRLTTEGDAQIGFWFFQDGLSPEGVGTPADKGYFVPPYPALGDLLVLVNFVNGGREGNVLVYRVESYNYDNQGNITSWNFLLRPDTDAASAQNNTQLCPVPADWDYPSETYPLNAFFEGYVDLAELAGTPDDASALCIGSFMLETRSSASLTASLDDFVGGKFQTYPDFVVTGDAVCAPLVPGPVSLELCASSEDLSLSYIWYSDEGLTNEVGVEACLTVEVTATTPFWVVATNQIGCLSEAVMVTAEIWANPVCVITDFMNLSAYMSNDGSIDLTVTSGMPPYSYAWTGPDGYTSDQEDIDGLAEGVYTVVITDDNGCQTSCSQEIIWPPTAPVCVITPADATCFGYSDGSATVEVSGGSGDYTLTWYAGEDPNIETDVAIGTGASISGLSAGLYTVYVYDNVTELISFCTELIEEPAEIILTCPEPEELAACSTDAEIIAAFDIWINSATATQGEDVLQVLNDWDQVYPDACGDIITLRFWVVDECADPGECFATFTVPAPADIVYTAPSGMMEESCDYADQAAVNTAISEWVAAQTLALEGSISNGCSPVVTNDWSDATIVLCDGGSVIVEWTITDLCETITTSATFMLTAPADIVYTAPSGMMEESCDYADQAAVNTAISEWVAAQTLALEGSISNGCSPVVTNDWSDATIVLCDGGSVIVEWTITDLCETITTSATFMLTAPADIVYTAPSGMMEESCDYADQAAVNTAISEWVAAQTLALEGSISNGCSPVVTNDWSDATIVLCDGGSVIVEWTITDLCETITTSATFMLTAPADIVYTAPSGMMEESCDYADQAAVNTAISEWVAAQTLALEGSISNGCSPVVTNDWSDATIVLCDGGSVIVEWTITDLCETITTSATFMLTAPADIVYTAPSGMMEESCDYADQAAVNTAISEWVAAQTLALEGSISNGCSPVVTNDWSDATIVLCDGGSVIVEWTITDLCETITTSATFMLTAPADIVYTAPSGMMEESCDYADQAAVNTAISEWVAAQTLALEGSISNGCSPVVTNDWSDATIVLCDGGSVIVEWTITDLCETITTSATFMLTAPADIVYTAPSGMMEESCDYADQAAVNTAISEWVAAQTLALEGSISNGCSPVVTNDWSDATIVLCDGGSVIVEWTITDLCETITTSATFMLTAPADIVYTAPSGMMEESCDYADQAAVNTAISEWVAAQTLALEGSISNGCSPVVTNDWSDATIVLCDGGSVIVEWTITDLCETITTSATFMLTAPADIVYTAPSGMMEESCDYADQAAVNTAISEWVAAQTLALEGSISNGCSPVVTNDWSDATIVLCDGGSVIVEWTITDLCETITTSATFMLTAPADIVYTAPSGMMEESCDYADQAAVNTAISEWVAAQTLALEGSISNGCSPVVTNDWSDATIVLCDGGSVIVEWTITDLCETITTSATFMLTAPADIVYTAPSGMMEESCDYADQAAVNTAISEWVAAQTLALEGSISNGCSPVVTNDWSDATIVLCDGGSVIVEWTITDLCETITTSATFMLTAPADIVYTAPSGMMEESCDYADQAAVNTAISEWVAAQTLALEGSISNGCSPVVTNDWSDATIVLCDGGSVIVEWTITDLCETITTSATFMLTAPADIVYTAPSGMMEESCDYADQAAVNTAISEWVAAQTLALEGSISNGCSPVVTNDWSDATIVLCDGGSVIVEWTITDLCETITTSATFMLTAPADIVYTAPSGMMEESCDYADQAAVNTAISEWVAAQTLALEGSISNGCSPVVTNDWSDATIVLCDGGSVIVEWTITDLCETITTSATFMLTAPADIVYTAPSGMMEESCDYADQAAVNTAISEWVAAQTLALEGSISNGCSPVVTNDWSDATIVLCDGGSVIVEWTITDLCETITTSATFMLTAPADIVYTAPSGMMEESCDYADQAAVNTAISEWVAAQTLALEGSISNGCSPVVTNDWSDATIVLCDGGSVIVEWTITDLCETITTSATFMLTAPADIVYTAPSGMMEESCDYADQAAVNTAISEWVAAQTLALEGSISNGCSPVVTNDWSDATIVLCDGGSVIVEWTITDLCETITTSATFMLTAPADIVYTAPSGMMEESCDYADQAAVNTAISEWVAAQTLALEGSISNGCSPVVTNDWSDATIVLCDGGSVIVEWTITDLCETITTSATFMLTAPADIVYTAPSGMMEESCDYADQAAVNTAISEWVAAQTLALEGSISNGCSPVVTNDWSDATIVLCDGGSVIVEWTITDLCETITTSATFMLTAPADIVYTAPSGMMEESCDYADQAAVNTAISEWVAAQTLALEGSISNGCSPVVTNDWSDATIVLCDGGSVIVEWTITDLCETITTSATFMLTAPADIVYTAPSGMMEESCDYADQAAVNTAISEWVAAQTLALEGSISNGCSPVVTNDWSDATIVLCDGGSVIVEWTITDLCETITTSATFMLTAPADIVYTAPSGMMEESCDYADQAAVNTAISEWVAAQTLALEGSISNGCSPVVTNDWSDATIVLCDGGSVIVEWTITDLCETITTSATFMLTAPAEVTYNIPADKEYDACWFADDDEVLTAFNVWLTEAALEANIGGGCNPQVNVAHGVLPGYCGGRVEVTWTITDLCIDPIVISADFIIKAPASVELTIPQDYTTEMCMSQEEVDGLFTRWLNAVTYDGGCNSMLIMEPAQPVAPNYCGGRVMVTWTVASDCEEDATASAVFMVPMAPAVALNTPPDYTTEMCLSQEEVNGLFARWLNAVTYEGGCNSMLTIEPMMPEAPDHCGGSVEVTWTVASSCEADVVMSATFTVPADLEAPVIDAPADKVVCMEALPEMLTATWTDNCDEGGELVAYGVLYEETECTTTWAYTFTVMDECGNPAEETVYITRETEKYANCETVYAKLPGDDARCFLMDGFNRWGWTNTISPSDAPYTMTLYAGAAQCDVSKGDEVGTVMINYNGESLSVEYIMNEGYALSEAHVYVGCDKYPEIVTGKTSKPTVAPGQYTFVGDYLDHSSNVTVNFTDVSGDVYVIVHGVACEAICMCSETENGDGDVFDVDVPVNCPSDQSAPTVDNEKTKGKNNGKDMKVSNLKVYPNPFSERVTFEFVSAKDARARLEIINAQGQKIATLMNENVRKGVMNRVQYAPVDVVPGILIYRLMLDENISTGKLILKE